MTALLARRHALDGTRIYDLGCSLGAGALAIRAALGPRRDVDILAVDSSPDMIGQLESRLEQNKGDNGGPDIRPVLGDICEVDISHASVVVLNFTLQFVPPPRRQSLIRRVADGLVPGGVLILSEKLRFPTPREQALQQEWHHDFKRAQGYSDLEIAAKRDAIENVLIPEEEQAHRQRLEAGGFSECYLWMRCFNFASFIALK
jgi:tRNA (cmo5U34)-methyltransferase